MACGRDGGTPVQYTCPADKGSLLTFEFRLWPDYEQPGSIDPGHRGPCAVYAKKMDSMEDQAAGPGWFKIWEDGYNPDTKKWCVDTLIENNGLLSVQLPEGLPSGSYLIRPEILALHNAWRGDPQFYVGCAQVFLQSDVSGPLNVPAEKSVSIPGYVNADSPGLTYNIYDSVLPPYPIPGPEVFIPAASPAAGGGSSSAQSAKLVKQQKGAVPSDCLVKNANWCGEPIARYTTEDTCYAGARQCYAQSKQCYASATPAGSANCKTWDEYCQQVSNGCDAGNFNGPPPFQASEKFATVPGPIPQPWNNIFKPEPAGSAQKNAGAPHHVETDCNGHG
ncbi:putative endo-beta-1 [Escovopsis weberi]|uniref:lytic cellulose monooxygenase (C4-dehydrogenating) n=1 Tax=Escovopsis weberi TaxID=150374 RepID=A0A0M8MVC4_ESCWE|nr:putative endo-beta-1 [Escovopsis weberi]